MRYTLWGVPIPAWLGEWAQEILGVPWRTRLTIFWVGVLIGLIIAATAFLAGAYASLFM